MCNSSNIHRKKNAFTQLAFIMLIYKKIQLQRFKKNNTYLQKSSSRNQLHHCNVPPNHRLVFSLVSQQHVASATISQNSKKIWTLLYFELVSYFLDFSLLIFGLWILERLPALWVTVNQLVLAHFNALTIPILS